MGVGLFKPYDTDSPNDEVAPSTTAAKGPAKKSVPTPSRRQAEQARRNRIAPQLTKKEIRERENKAKYKSRDEALARTNSEPANVLIQYYVDGRWNLAEFMIPVMLLIFVAIIVSTYVWPSFLMLSTYIIWGLFALLVFDFMYMWFGLRQQLMKHFPNEPRKGKMWMAFSRAMLMRRSRTPAPRVKRGTKFVWPPEGLWR